MTAEEVNTFLDQERTCRLATCSASCEPRLTPLWFVWHDGAIWLNSLVASQRWADLRRNPAAAVLVDAGTDYQELRGVEVTGTVEIVGEVPRRGEHVDELIEPERLFGLKYRSTPGVVYDGLHGWLRLRPDRVLSWDFRKISAARQLAQGQGNPGSAPS
jgi:nitroimidazol reductase NimA-like FMN-containing flavoprotein (pyridoxamine 5'-phosphate oxidase superfamily)